MTGTNPVSHNAAPGTCPIQGERQLLATAAKWTHIVGSYALLLSLAGHVGLVLRHQPILKDGLLLRIPAAFAGTDSAFGEMRATG